jgi:flavin reductase (DIM6/NTAB) family NADH-FMN oxidoreductase RutF
MPLTDDSDLITLQPDQPFFETMYAPSPLVIVGTRESDDSGDLAPKHMAMPLGWSDYFGFVCTPAHSTYQNAERTGSFTVSYPRPENILEASLAAGPRDEAGDKPSLTEIETVAADAVDAPAVADAYAVLECEVEDVVDGFGENALVAGEIVGKHVHRDAYRATDEEPETVFERAPALTYFYPDRFASVSETQSFPFPEGFER